MKDEATKPRNEETGEPAAETTEFSAEPGFSTEDGAPAQELRDDESELDGALRERAEYLANWQRAKADYQNLRRRTQADIEAAVRRELIPLLESVLQILDNLELALGTECTSGDARNLMVGVRMTRDQMKTVLESHDVAPIVAEGAFDPNRHQAVATIATSDHEPGQVIEVVRTGWTFRDQVLRPAHVKVSVSPADEPEDAGEATPDSD